MKIVFSTLYSENLDYLKIYIDNFLLFSDATDALIINSNYDFDLRQIQSERVVIHRGKTLRDKLGATLLQGHIENFQFAKKLFNDEFYFCTVASNCLFFRKYEKQLLEKIINSKSDRTLINKVDYEKRNFWWWPKISAVEGFSQIFKNSLLNSQIEGFITKSENWNHIEKFGQQLLEISANTPREYLFPFEEVVPSTVLTALNLNFTLLAKVFWERVNTEGTRFTAAADILNPKVPKQICMYKWFHRSDSSFITQMVADEKLYKSVEIIAEHTELRDKPFAIFELAEISLSKGGFKTLDFLDGCKYKQNFTCTLSDSRKLIELSNTENFGFIYYEKIISEINASIQVDLTTSGIKISCGGRENSGILLAIVYIKLPSTTKAIAFNGFFKKADIFLTNRVTYIKSPILYRSLGILIGDLCYLEVPDNLKNSPYLGIPVYEGSDSFHNILSTEVG